MSGPSANVPLGAPGSCSRVKRGLLESSAESTARAPSECRGGPAAGAAEREGRRGDCPLSRAASAAERAQRCSVAALQVARSSLQRRPARGRGRLGAELHVRVLRGGAALVLLLPRLARGCDERLALQGDHARLPRRRESLLRLSLRHGHGAISARLEAARHLRERATSGAAPPAWHAPVARLCQDVGRPRGRVEVSAALGRRRPVRRASVWRVHRSVSRNRTPSPVPPHHRSRHLHEARSELLGPRCVPLARSRCCASSAPAPPADSTAASASRASARAASVACNLRSYSGASTRV